MPPDSLRHTRAFIIYIRVVINKKRERIDDTNEREFSRRLILFDDAAVGHSINNGHS